MKVNELRIGNFIIESLSFGSDKVIKVDPNIFNRRIDEFIPITLTEEWLEKFKEWKKEDDLYVRRLDTIVDSLRLDYINDDEELCWEFYVHNIRGEKVGCAYIKYVHELQNLYFALYQRELEIKLT